MANILGRYCMVSPNRRHVFANLNWSLTSHYLPIFFPFACLYQCFPCLLPPAPFEWKGVFWGRPLLQWTQNPSLLMLISVQTATEKPSLFQLYFFDFAIVSVSIKLQNNFSLHKWPSLQQRSERVIFCLESKPCNPRLQATGAWGGVCSVYQWLWKTDQLATHQSNIFRSMFYITQTRVADPVPDPDPGAQKWPTKVEKIFKSSSFEVLDGLFWELKASSVTWTFFMEA